MSTEAKPEIPGYAIINQPPATGRTARVFKAVELDSGSTVAIKVLTASVEPNPFFEEAFKRETLALSELRHANIVRMRGSGATASGQNYIALEWMASDLKSWKERSGAFDWGSFWAQVGRPLTEAAAHAHAANIVHRDLAPRNILFDDRDVPKIADFGLSKLMRYIRSEQTLREFASPPFTPSEVDDGSRSFSRDVFSLATLFVWAAAPTDLQTYEAVRAFAAATDVFDPGLRRIILDALSHDPEERPAAGEDLLHQLDGLRRRATSRVTTMGCLLELSENKTDALARTFGLGDRRSVEAAILDDLNAICGIRLLSRSEEQAAPRKDGSWDLQLLGLNFSYHARLETTLKDRLVLLGARSIPNGILERQRETAFVHPMEFRFASRGRQADRQATADLQASFAAWSAEVEELASNFGDARLFEAWSRILQAKQDVEAARERPIRYSGFRVEGRRVLFHARGTIPSEVVLEQRQVRLEDGSFLTGHVDGVEGDIVSFVVGTGDPALLRSEGEIAFSVYAASEALRRQQRALDAFKSRTVAQPRLSDVILSPEIASPPLPVEGGRFFQDGLDEDKQSALRVALGAPDVMLLRGPPGTGKTVFIAELVLQALEANPEARILLCSQTNVAVDNAIERVVELRPLASRNFEVVRLGNNDERIAASVEPLRLARRLQAWTEQVTASVRSFIEGEANSMGVDRDNVAMGMLLERLHSTLLEIERIETLILAEEAALADLPRRQAGQIPDDGLFDLDVAGSINARRLELARLRDDRRRALSLRNEVQQELTCLGTEGAELAVIPRSDLEGYIGLYFAGRSGDVERLKTLMALGADWTLRFGRQDHFEAPFLSMTDVVAGTCVGIAGPRSAAELAFDLCIVDEASKATATEVLVPLSRAKKWVLVGDSKQLPPFQDEALRSAEIRERYDLRREDVAESVFGYFERKLPEACVRALTTQHRMIQPINDLIAACFYPNQELACARTDPGANFGPTLPHRITWFDTSGRANRRETAGDTGVSNRLECETIRALLEGINKRQARRARGKEAKRITAAVLTGYAGQKGLLERTLNPRSPKWTHVHILLNTVDAFQGRQADLAIYSVTRCNDEGKLGFLNEFPRLNVALSRGRDALAIVGDRRFCAAVEGENPFRSVIDWMSTGPACGVEEV